MTTDGFDIAPFALPNTPSNEVWFEEPRDIARIEAEFGGEVPGEVAVWYLRKTWPWTRLEDSERGDPCRLGWVPQDDWFNVTWQRAAVDVKRVGEGRVACAFRPLRSEAGSIAEQDGKGSTEVERLLEDYDVMFRRTLGLRVEPAGVTGVRVFTTSISTATTLRVALDAGRRTPGARLRLEGYNLVVERLSPCTGDAEGGDRDMPSAGVDLAGPGSRAFDVAVRHLVPSHPYCGDDGLLTLHLDGEAFTVSLTSLEAEGPIWFEEMGVFITRGDDATSFEEYRARQKGAKTIARRVREHQEQSLANATHGQPRPHAVSYNLGCTHARQRFWLESNGDVLLHKRNVEWVEGRDTHRFRNSDVVRVAFGLEQWSILARYPDPEPVLAYTILARRDGLTVEQQSFAMPLLVPIHTGVWAGDDPMVCLVRLRFRNESEKPLPARLLLAWRQDSARAPNHLGAPREEDGYRVPRGRPEALQIAGSQVLGMWQGAPVVRCSLCTTMEAAVTGHEIEISQRLEPGGTCEAVLRIPYITLDGPEELVALEKLDFARCHEEVTTYWRAVAGRGARVRTPEPRLNALHTAHLAHVLVTDFEMPDGSGLVNTSVGTSTYGNFSNEACMIVNELDRRGLHDEARRRLGIWLEYQGTVAQPGNFTDRDGMFYGAGGFECGAYNQHHGWVLWCLCEHLFLSRDVEWFLGIADAVVAGADWVFRQRRNTMGELPHSRGWEQGFLPAGSLEDVTDFHYWLSTNALTWRGVEWAARALEKAGHREARRVREEADAYRADLVQGFETMRRHAPLVRLRDGRWAPQFPSRLYRRGRETGWIRETLEGAVYLPISGLHGVESKAAEWILDDYQDNRYVRPPYGYLIPDFEMTWFDRAGFSIQPNLLAGLIPHLERDEPEVVLWMFFNAWAACYREEINAMVEHPMPVLGYANEAHFKTSDQANAVTWLRNLFVYACGDVLHLGRALPRAWFGQGEPFEAREVVTRFGRAGIRYEPLPGKDAVRATATLELAEDPEQVLIRFRHPKREPIRDVWVNGASCTPADALKGDVDLTSYRGEVEVEVCY